MIRTLGQGVLALVLTAGCGYAGSNEAGDTDAAPACTMTIELASGQVTTGDTVSVRGRINDVQGISIFTWSITHDGGEIAFEDLEPDRSEIAFTPQSPGVYDIVLSGAADGGPCTDATATVNAVVPGATPVPVALSVVPPDGVAIPAQEIALSIYPGTDYALGNLSLEAGFLAQGTVRNAAGDPVAAYVRAEAAADEAPVVEGFSATDGHYTLAFPSTTGIYDVLVVPADPLAAGDRFAAVAVDTIGDLSLSPAITVTGTVRDGAGDPVAGARVQVTVDGAPSAVAVSDAAGALSFASRAGIASRVTVVPPPGAGLLALDATFGQPATLSAESHIEVTFSAAAGGVTVAPKIKASDGSAAAGARAVWVARQVTVAGEVAIGGQGATVVSGHAVLSATADASGAMPPIAVPEATYDVILEPQAATAGGASVTTVDVTAGAPANLSLAVPATVTGHLIAADGTPLAGARITALPSGVAATSFAGAATAIAATDGGFSLPVIAGASYRLEAAPGPGKKSPRSGRVVVAPAAGMEADVGDWKVAPGVLITATLSAPGAGNLAGVYVTARCAACAEDPAWVAPEAVTDASGNLTLILPADLATQDVPAVTAPSE
ncbi:MAG TPA: carboxypeptidase-like regulatory domain-containing protein [Kofleriaceae bacterium]|nr:carboxypeptidase-like regulatory domain-containing protein [Kofleriaceae bacterium]